MVIYSIVAKIKLCKDITKQDIISLTFTPIMGGKIGREEGKSELLIKMLIKKFKKVPDEYKKKIKSLP